MQGMQQLIQAFIAGARLDDAIKDHN